MCESIWSGLVGDHDVTLRHLIDQSPRSSVFFSGIGAPS